MSGLVTKQRARTYGFNYNKWKLAMNSALTAKYQELALLGKKLGAILESDDSVKITSKSGTDLSFKLARRKTRIEDGIIDSNDLEIGNLGISLPTGSVSLAPQEDSAWGTVVFDLPIPQAGKLVQNLTWRFENGKVVALTAKKNLDAVKDIFDNSHGDKDKLGSLTVGLNPKAKYGFLINSMVAGAVSIGLGDNRELGGVNDSDYGFYGTMSDATVQVDVKLIVENGKIAV